jgi:hypothetical protein
MFTEVPFSKKGGHVGPRVSPERKAYVKKESEILFAKNEISRQKAKEEMFLRRKERDLITEAVREERVTLWQNRTKNSPFAVDLVAEVERINEENAIRSLEQESKSKIVGDRREKAKNDIILKVSVLLLAIIPCCLLMLRVFSTGIIRVFRFRSTSSRTQSNYGRRAAPKGTPRTGKGYRRSKDGTISGPECTATAICGQEAAATSGVSGLVG